MTPCKPSTVCTFTTGYVPVMVLSEEEDTWICPTMPISLTYHNVNFLLIETALCPTRATPLSGIGGICGWHWQRSSVWFFLHPHLWKGTSVQGHTTPYCTTSKTAWQHKHTALLHRWCFYIFVQNCTVELLGTCSRVDQTFTFTLKRGRRPHLLQRGNIW